MITLDYRNPEGVEALLDKIEDALKIEDILDEAEAIQLNRIRTRFLTERDTEGVKWQPSFAGLRRRAQGGTGTLFDTGTLFHSIQAFSLGPNERAIGTDVPYAEKHQEGLDGAVKREFIGASIDDLEIIEMRIVQRVLEALS